MNRDVFFSLLALDAYNRGPGAGIAGFEEEGSIGRHQLEVSNLVNKKVGKKQAFTRLLTSSTVRPSLPIAARTSLGVMPALARPLVSLMISFVISLRDGACSRASPVPSKWISRVRSTKTSPGRASGGRQRMTTTSFKRGLQHENVGQMDDLLAGSGIEQLRSRCSD